MVTPEVVGLPGIVWLIAGSPEIDCTYSMRRAVGSS
jgi:hypothetical protein